MDGKKLAVISSDTDWAHPDTVSEAHELLSTFRKPISYFLTQDYSGVFEASSIPIEIAPHPNLAGIQDLDTEVGRSLRASPGAVSFRAHSLHWTERLRPVLRKYELSISSSAMMYLQPGLQPFPVGYEITEVPLFWMDMFHLEYCQLSGASALDATTLNLEEPGLKVFDIHPVHVVLNTRAEADYQRAKSDYHNPIALRRRRNRHRGVWDLFAEVMNRLERFGYEFCLIRDVPSHFASPAPLAR